MGGNMPLTPEDVSNKRFTPVRLREGYDMGEVDQFLDEVEAELARLTRENDDLRGKLSAAQKGGGATAHSQYVGTLRTHLEGHKINPRTNLIGTAVVRFKVNAAGELLKREIATSSGKKALDDAALASIEKSAPFPKMPEGLSETIELSVPFRFTVR